LIPSFYNKRRDAVCCILTPLISRIKFFHKFFEISKKQILRLVKRAIIKERTSVWRLIESRQNQQKLKIF